MLGALTFGRFELPELAATPCPTAGSPRKRQKEAIRWLLVEPVRVRHAPNALIWVEEDFGTRELRVMAWDPVGPAEIAEAVRFYQAAHWKSWTTVDDLQRLLRAKGPWLIRWNLLGRYEFLTSKDEHVLFGLGSSEFLLFHSHPSKGVQVTADEALALIPRLMQEYGGYIFEPVKPAYATKDLRSIGRKRLPSAGLAVPPQDRQSNQGPVNRNTQKLIEGLLAGSGKARVLQLYESAKRLQQSLRNSPPLGFAIPE
jgi:hypothetical protein